MCAVEQSLNKYLDSQEKQEKSYLRFEIEAYDLIKELRNLAKDYDGYDFSEELETLWSEL